MSQQIPFNMSIIPAFDAFNLVQEKGFTNDLLVYLPKDVVLTLYVSEFFVGNGDRATTGHAIMLPFSIQDGKFTLKIHGIAEQFYLSLEEANKCTFFKSKDKGAAAIARFTYDKTLIALGLPLGPNLRENITLSMGRPEDNNFISLYSGHDVSVFCESVVFVTLQSELSGERLLYYTPMNKLQTEKLCLLLKTGSGIWTMNFKAALPSSVILEEFQFKRIKINYEKICGYVAAEAREDRLVNKLKPENIDREFFNRWTDQKTT